MRTSRISRDTAHIVDALAARPRRAAAQQALRTISPALPPADTDDSELSAPPDSPDAAAEDDTRRKRKRGAQTRGKQKVKKEKATAESGRGVAPFNWQQMYECAALMRKKVIAPVDTMGSLMLSSQTKDTVTAVAMKQLQEGLPGGFNLDALLHVQPEALNRLIYPVGFHNRKTIYIKQVAVILKEQFDGDIPQSIEGLMSLPGVGPKMAYLTMSAAWGRDEGIGVDVHVHRITNLWHWHKTSTPEHSRVELESWLPREKWHEINHLLVGLGQTICLPIGRKCDECDLGKQKLCPSAVERSPRKKAKKEIEIKVEDDEVVVAKPEADDRADTVQIKPESVEELGRGARH